MITICNRNQIDTLRWDAIIANSPGANLYAYSWYLDAVNKNWIAIIFDDYAAVMPVFFKKILWIKWCYQPWFLQQLGIFSAQDITKQQINEARQLLQQTFNHGHYSFSSANTALLNTEKLIRQTQFLNLNKSYDTLQDAYRNKTRGHIHFAKKQSLNITETTNCEEFTAFLFRHLGEEILPQKQQKLATRIFKSLFAQNKCSIYWVKTNDQLKIAGCLLAKDGNRLYFLQCASSPEGRNKRAMHYLVDHIIKSHSESKLTLDFCGSSLNGVSYFNEGFGADKEYYAVINI